MEETQNTEMQIEDSTTAMPPIMHKRSKSDSDKKSGTPKLDSSLKSFHYVRQDVGEANDKGGIKNQKSLNNKVPSSLRQEIQQLEKRLQDQFSVHCALEKSLGFKSYDDNSSDVADAAIPKRTKELIKEIAILELEVMYLEQHLLSLYRKAFEQQITHLSPSAGNGIEIDSKKQMSSPSEALPKAAPTLDSSPRKQNPSTNVQSGQIVLPRKSATGRQSEACAVPSQDKRSSFRVHRSHSSLLQRSVCSARVSPSARNLARALKACHTLPLSFPEVADQDKQSVGDSGILSLADHLGARIGDHIPETPNNISEDMVRCMCAVYCRLKDPPTANRGFSCSPSSSFSSMSVFSSHYTGDAWSPGFRKEATLEAWLDNPFRVDGLKDFSGPYNAMVEVSSICRGTQRFSDAEVMLHNYNSLVHRLETVDPSGMKSEEKLAFWINVHNAMTMHAHLEHGIPQSSMKRASLLTKTTYIINGASINAEIIQDILGCRINPPGQWLRILLYPKSHPKDGDEWQAYSVKHPEPLLHFALCSGTRSDPAVRIYSPKRLFQQLEAAKEEYIRATISIQKEQKILLPKNIETYAKAADLTADDLLNMIRSSLPESLRMIMERCRQGRSRKLILWVPHNYSFRYLIPRELAQFSHNTSM
ncbi:uncharacterized protein LOC109713423 [Ananas comosus]|uniref:Uncharacterized protein LOC109713423 n=1 Tax=Ananas comosus TaxID=4615 RepID=A0A6P5FIV3_ANACO|nr:uncharacterized protein LOC109713423 [Ananas comosus]